MKLSKSLIYIICMNNIINYYNVIIKADVGDPYTLLTKMKTQCEYKAIQFGTMLADSFNSYDESTEWDARIHSDELSEYLGFSDWEMQGRWGSNGISTEKKDAKELYKKGGWSGFHNMSLSSYWALENQWIYMMGDSTMRQVWSSYAAAFQGNDFERNAKEWTRENCMRQYPNRKKHPAGEFFPDEGWGGKCGNNELTCHLAGYGKMGKLTFDWKHFPYEDYDEWLFGEYGLWNDTASPTLTAKPDVLVIQTGLHTCFHALATDMNNINMTMIQTHEKDITKLMISITNALKRSNDTITSKPIRRLTDIDPTSRQLNEDIVINSNTIVIFMTTGRTGIYDHRADKCVWRFNRYLVREAHRFGFPVLEREELERRILFKSEHFAETRYLKYNLHLETPSFQMIATSLLFLISCLRRNGTESTRVNQYF